MSRRISLLEVEFCEETPEVLSSPRGWGESSYHTVEARRIGDEIEFEDLTGKHWRVKRSELQDLLRLR